MNSSFDALGLSEALVRAVADLGYTQPTPIQLQAIPAVLAGGGMKRGFVYGTSDKDAAYAIDKPVSPEDLAATIYTALGINPHLQLPDAQGRPVSIVDGGRVLEELFV